MFGANLSLVVDEQHDDCSIKLERADGKVGKGKDYRKDDGVWVSLFVFTLIFSISTLGFVGNPEQRGHALYQIQFGSISQTGISLTANDDIRHV